MMKASFSYLYGKLRVVVSDRELNAKEWSAAAVEINPDSLDQGDRDNYDLYKQAYAEMRAAKQAFEGGLKAKLGIVVEAKPERKAKGGTSLADFMKSRDQAGLSS